MIVCQECIRATDHLIKCIEFNGSFLLLDNPWHGLQVIGIIKLKDYG